MQITMFGATGILGRHVVPRLCERGHRVRAVVRQPEQAAKLQRLGVEARLGDILDATSLTDPVTDSDAVLHLATAIPKPGGAQDWSRNDRIRREGTQYLLAACQRAGVRRYVQQSITFIYGDHGTVLADETTPPCPTPFLQSAVDMEAFVQATTLDWCILRGGFFYGPGTTEDSWRDAARTGTLQFPDEGRSLISLIHVADMARAIVLATEQAVARSIYNVVDDQPVTYVELYQYVAAQVGGPPPVSGGPMFLPPLGCRNDRLKAELGWLP
ncbi:MAG: NAD(P)H-binding protein, partial [Deltaproteobacteria bacterium]|nr:NAD(P)H-binding protein [Deltaproteobacteria bacterium]